MKVKRVRFPEGKRIEPEKRAGAAPLQIMFLWMKKTNQ